MMLLIWNRIDLYSIDLYLIDNKSRLAIAIQNSDCVLTPKTPGINETLKGLKELTPVHTPALGLCIKSIYTRVYIDYS